jgi:hypothetical protein
MTSQERLDLQITLDFLKEWREDDRKWKDKADATLDDLSTRVASLERTNEIEAAAKDAIDKEEAAKDERWYRSANLWVGAIGGVLVVLAQFIVDLFNNRQYLP